MLAQKVCQALIENTLTAFALWFNIKRDKFKFDINEKGD